MKTPKLLSAQNKETVKGDAFCTDIDGNVYFGSSTTLYSMDSNSEKIYPCVEFTEHSEESKNVMLDMEFLFENNSIFIAFSSGEIYLYSIDDEELSSVGNVETGLEGFGWSPNQELLVLLTGAGTLILMTKDFDAITEKVLCTDEFGENKPINVGWGSKTTQFHGSEGKDAAFITQKEPKPALFYDDHRSRISWRKDGDYFVTSSINESKGYRQLRIWSQEAVLQFTGEIVEGLEEPISWRPLGNVITCSQQCPNKHKIRFFEKNGLQHGEFTLPFQPNKFKVTHLSWNSDSSILLVVAEELIDDPLEFHVMLWTTSNYHWYLKQKLQVPKSKDQSGRLLAKWSTFQPNELHCYDPIIGKFYIFKWAWSILHNPYNCCQDSLVLSIDNENIMISPFGKMVVPPPLCAYMYSTMSHVQSVFFAPNQPAFGVYFSNGKIAIFMKGFKSTNESISDDFKLKLVAAGGNGFKSQVEPYSYAGSFSIGLDCAFAVSFGLCHWTWVNSNQLLFTCYCKGDNQIFKYLVLSVELPQSFSSNPEKITPRILAKLDTSVVAMCTNSSGSIVAIHLDDGKVCQLNFDDANDTLIPWISNSSNETLVLPQLCTNMSIITISGKEYILGLSEKYNLFCNDTIILPNCTSYFVTEGFLLATTVDHVLKCFSREYDVTNSFMKSIPLPSKVQSQKIEKGAKIVISPASTTKVILQMPRGNLETIHPRPLVLSAICKFLDQFQFGKAFELAKVHRIDLNVLYDYNPKQFLENIDKVIGQISMPSDLNLFLASLKKEDVCVTMYPLIFKPKLHENTFQPNKINIVCDEFKKNLEAKQDDKYFQTVIATLAKRNPPQVDQALIHLKNLKDSNDSKYIQDLVDSALNFLLYLIDVNELMDVALGTYDLETTIMVAQKSQKDPKEFLPFYNDLQKLEENYRKYKIDMHLKRYKEALQNISKCDDHFDECLALIKEQRLYSYSLQLFPFHSDRNKIVWKEFGNYLKEKRYFDQAGAVFARVEDHTKALLAYKEGLNWQMALCSAYNLSYSEMQIISLCQDMAIKLKSYQKHRDAAYILEQYVKDVEEAIVTLLEGYEWDMALLMMSKYMRNDIMDTHFVPALEEHYTYLQLHLNQLSQDFNNHLERLKFLRSQKLKEGEQSNVIKCAEDDLFSDIGSVTDVSCASLAESNQMSGSIMTRKSSKSRRKQKLKKYRVKEGSANEDLAHVVVLSEIVTKVDTLKDTFDNTIRVLVQFGYDDPAKYIHGKMMSLVELIELEMKNIWNPVDNSNPSQKMKFGPDSTVNSITASLQQENGNAAPSQIDPELMPPPWRNIDLGLQIYH